MVIISYGKGTWIDAVEGSITTAASTGYHIAIVNIAKSGIFLGGVMTVRSGQTVELSLPALQPAGGGALDIGDELALSVRIGINQDDATARTITFNMLLFMRDKGKGAG